MPSHHTINYIEFPSHDLPASQTFFEQVFDWSFESYGPTHIAFRDANGLDGGFYHSTQNSHSTAGAPLVILHSEQLEATLQKNNRCWWRNSKRYFCLPRGTALSFSRTRWQ